MIQPANLRVPNFQTQPEHYEAVGYTTASFAPCSLSPWRVQELSDGAWEQVELVCSERLRHVRPCFKPGKWISGSADCDSLLLVVSTRDHHVKLHEMTKRQQ